jgi:hypothetical protein
MDRMLAAARQKVDYAAGNDYGNREGESGEGESKERQEWLSIAAASLHAASGPLPV